MGSFLAILLGYAFSVFVFKVVRDRMAGPPGPHHVAGVESLPPVERIGGLLAYGEWHMRETDVVDPIPLGRYRLTVAGLLPDWLTFRTSSDDFRAVAAFGRPVVDALPRGWTLIAETGDLVLEAQDYAQRDSALERVAFEAAKKLVHAYQAGGLDALEARLREAAASRPHALRIVALRFRDSPETQALLAAGLTSSTPAMRLTAASYSGPEGDPVLSALLLDPELDLALRKDALAELKERKQLEAILKAAMTSEPGLDVDLARALDSFVDLRVEPIALGWLRSADDDLVKEVGDLLQRQGTRAALGPVRERIAEGDLGPRAANALELAATLIKDRLGDVGQDGALAIVTTEGGELSIASDDKGALSDPEA